MFEQILEIKLKMSILQKIAFYHEKIDKFKDSRGQKIIITSKQINPKMRPKNDRTKYRKQFKF